MSYSANESRTLWVGDLDVIRYYCVFKLFNELYNY